eukprot:TRINITY_DN38308_c0_g1_i1.p2 TRINITY_DN38308_c0_g1~~TRINITY_DN38308_c0_g1_i1.p2  ORF type:complete len:114 (+),score=36.17 TRINITY_DN38308_c0_g1_i1:120-461(+)
MIRRPPRSTQGVSSAASDVYKRQYQRRVHGANTIRVLQKRIDQVQLEKYEVHTLQLKDEKARILNMENARTIQLEENLRRQQENTRARELKICLLYTSPSPRDLSTSRMPSSA